MADWADEMARAGNLFTADAIAAALRQARLDALEEAAQLAQVTPMTKGNPWEWPEDIAAALRALKDKQP